MIAVSNGEGKKKSLDNLGQTEGREEKAQPPAVHGRIEDREVFGCTETESNQKEG